MSSAPLDRRTLLTAAAAGVTGAVVADDALAAPALRKVSATFKDPDLALFKNRASKRPIDGFNEALVLAAGKLPLRAPGQSVKVVKIELSARAVYAKDPGAYDEYTVSLTF